MSALAPADVAPRGRAILKRVPHPEIDRVKIAKINPSWIICGEVGRHGRLGWYLAQATRVQKAAMSPKSDWSRTGLADLHRQGFMKAAFARPKKPKAPPSPATGCDLCQDWHQPGKHRYVVWSVTGDVPLGDGKPFVDLKSAKQAAETRARSMSLDQAVSIGYNPTHPKFKIAARFEGGSGERLA